MSETMHIAASERGLIRVFAIDLPRDEARDFVEQPEDRPGWPFLDALGAEGLDPDWIDLVLPGDLGEMTLSEFLAEGPGAAPEALAGDRARLDALEVPVVILPSETFCGRDQSLTPRAPLRWIGTYSEPKTPMPETPLRSSAAEGHLSPGDASGSARPGLSLAAWVVAALVALGAVVLGLSLMGARQ